jgi:hypothetical protein
LLLFDSVGMADVEVDQAKDDKYNGQHNLSQPAIHQQKKTQIKAFEFEISRMKNLSMYVAQVYTQSRTHVLVQN